MRYDHAGHQPEEGDDQQQANDLRGSDPDAAVYWVARMLEADGVLTLGAAESVVGISDAFKPYPDRRGLYRPNAARTPRAGVAAVVPHALKVVASAVR